MKLNIIPKKLKLLYRDTLILVLVVFFAANMIVSCGGNQQIDSQLNKAEELMGQQPDSSLTILKNIDRKQPGSDKERARYALLLSQAFDKNYIDTTTFDVLQPAIDYYLEYGTPDEKLRTLYYQGCIYLNKSDLEMAMQSYLKAADLKEECQDTIMFANLLVAQGSIYAKSCQIEQYVSNNLQASQLYNKTGNHRRELSSLIRALDGSVSLGNKERADSILALTGPLLKMYPELQDLLVGVRMTYGISFESDSIINDIIGQITDLSNFNEETKLDIALGYLKLNEPLKAKMVFESIDTNILKPNSFRYLSIKPEVYETNREYEEALKAFKMFHSIVEAENSKIYSQKTAVAKDLHELKISHLYSLQRKDRQIWVGLCVVLALVIIIGVIYYQLRLGSIKRFILKQDQYRLQLENDNLQKQNSVLKLEKNNAELECEKHNLAAENMRLKITQLESECERLKETMKESELSKPILDAIQERIGILNGLLAAKISDNESYSKPFEKWINQVTEDKKSFMDSTQLAFRASHPALMKYLDEHGLTESELNYVCLYAIGLRGKDIGEYIQIKRHYHISSDIRKKLGLKEDDTNLGLHIRNLMRKL